MECHRLEGLGPSHSEALLEEGEYLAPSLTSELEAEDKSMTIRETMLWNWWSFLTK